MSVNINDDLRLRLLDIQAFFTNQWLGTFPNDYHRMAELIKIKKQQQTLKDLANQEDSRGRGAGGGRGTIKGLRGKDDAKKNPFTRKMTRR